MYKKSTYLIAGSFIFVLFCLLFAFVGRYNFCYVEQWHTFVYHSAFVCDTLSRPGGFVQLLADFLTQFFLHPWAGIVISSLLLTSITLLTSQLLTSQLLTANFFLSLFPALSLFFLLYNVNFNYAGTVAFLPMLLLLLIRRHIPAYWPRFIYSLLSIPLLFVLAGPITLLYSILLILTYNSCKAYKTYLPHLLYLLCPLFAYALALTAIRLGYAGDLKHLLLPDGYFVLRLQPGSVIYLPWGVTLAVFIISIALNYLLPSLLGRGWGRGCLLVAVIAYAFFGIRSYIDRHNEQYKQLDYYANHRRWDSIIDRCQTLPLNNLLFQNYLNLSLAERGMLSDLLFREPCIDIRTIYVIADKNPYISSLLSDIYFSMGHIAFSQRYAFEANEGMGNLSPRMLKRLVQTNLIYGSYATAERYIYLLQHTLFYRDWAAAHRRFLYDDAAVEADPLLGNKRRCLFPDNRFSGLRGLDDDLKQIVLSNPDHRPTLHYLGCLYLLSKDLNRFRQTLETFYLTPAMPDQQLPVAFQEAVAVIADGDKEMLAHYHISPEVLSRYEQFKIHPRQHPQTLWFFLKYRL